jgi:hypothetical protein
MEALLLVLVLSAGDPGSVEAATAVAEALRLQDPKARVVLAADAATELTRRDLRDADLVARSERVLTETAKDLKLVIVRIERRQSGPDQVIDVDLWSGGRRDGMSAVSGNTGTPGAADPLGQAVDGARRLLREASHDPAAAAERADRTFLSRFIERGDWTGLILAVDARQDASPRLRCAAIMARLRLGDRDGATAALAVVRSVAPDHPLVREAAAALESDAGGVDAMRDPAPGDDGGNILR